MKLTLATFQQEALKDLRDNCITAQQLCKKNQCILSLSAPTGAGKTIIMANLIEDILCGSAECVKQENAVFLWLSGWPELNEQSLNKIYFNANNLAPGTLIPISDDSFDEEVFADGKVYFLNTQKLGVNSNLTKNRDGREYTIWETIENTISRKRDRFFLIIDEAHYGARSRGAENPETIMQKFVLGSKDDNLSSLPIIIGMSATIERFRKLIEGARAMTLPPVEIKPEDVKDSGLLKDKIIIDHQKGGGMVMEMAILAEATSDWIDKCSRWEKYCKEQGEEKIVKPILAIQVENSGGNEPSRTDLDECLKTIERVVGRKFEVGEVIHAFGDPKTDITVYGLKVPYIEPSRIEDAEKVKIVFFKESLSTGWDCPRVETMMSFRTANDSTYIAQLMGRIVRTPLHRRVDTDEVLNNVHLFLPYFDKNTVDRIVKDLNSEGISSDIETASEQQTLHVDEKFCEVFDWLNEQQFITWQIKRNRINNYLTSLFALTNLLRNGGWDAHASKQSKYEIVAMIKDFIGRLKDKGQYEDAINGLRKDLRVSNEYDNRNGGEVSVSADRVIEATEYDIEKNFKRAQAQLAHQDLGMLYCKEYTVETFVEHQLDFILYSKSEYAMKELEEYAKRKFYDLQNRWRKDISAGDDKYKTKYDSIVAEGDEASPHSLKLWETITLPYGEDFKEESEHMFVNKDGKAVFKLDTWEKDILDEEKKRPDFVCWVRNQQNKGWALCIKYEMDRKVKSFYPDFLIIRKEGDRYVVDLLEPHNPAFNDNYAKTIGLYEYLKEEKGIARAEIIRMEDNRFLRLNVGDSMIQHDVMSMHSDDDLNNLFRKYNS